jgi:predicted AlkP superfamily pyrophosphatase or phosphodiesterase
MTTPRAALLPLLLLTACPQARRVEAPARKPTVILISVDGLRADYPERVELPTVARLAAEGVRAEAMVPVFPSKTFPNHYSLVTGLWAEEHGILDNTIYDPDTDEWFSMTDSAAVSDARWWGGEPIWVTAERQGLITATCFWPGSEAPIGGVRPTYYVPYDGGMPYEDRVARVLDWLDEEAPPQLITLYFDEPDGAGHKHGPDDPAVLRAAQDVDEALAGLIDGLEARGILDDVHVLITADHGMASISLDRVVLVDDYVDAQKLQTVTWTPVLSFYPTEGLSAEDAVAALSQSPHLRCAKKEDRPPDQHLSNHPRLPPVICDAEEGWSISGREWFSDYEDLYEGGAHGYDPAYSSMHGVILGRGPRLMGGRGVGPTRAVDVYNLLAALLEITPATNSGDPAVAEDWLGE